LKRAVPMPATEHQPHPVARGKTAPPDLKTRPFQHQHARFFRLPALCRMRRMQQRRGTATTAITATPVSPVSPVSPPPARKCVIVHPATVIHPATVFQPVAMVARERRANASAPVRDHMPRPVHFVARLGGGGVGGVNFQTERGFHVGFLGGPGKQQKVKGV
jgi:hypothetical protein